MASITQGAAGLGTRALQLPGWGRLSVWGWDAQGGHLYAQLWNDASGLTADDRPEHWISPPAWPVTGDVRELARQIAHATRVDLPAVLDALARSSPPTVADAIRSAAA